MSITAIVMTVLLVAALGTFAFLVLPRFRLLFAVQPENRLDNVGKRVGSVIQFVLMQWRMPRDPIAGFAHIFLFFGFLAVSVATILHFVHAYAPTFHLPGALGQGYSLIKDIFEMLVLVACAYALFRRLRPKLTRVGKSWEGTFVLCMIAVLMLTDFLITGGELVVANSDGLPWAPGGYLGYQVLAGLGADGAHTAGVVSYWIHCVVLLVFLNFLPIGKHFHVITSFPQLFLRNLRPWGQGKPEADLIKAMEDDDFDTIEKLGVGSTADLTWPMVLDTYSCTECGRCTMYCPTVVTNKPLEHRKLNKAIKNAVYADKDVLLSGDKEKLEGLEPLVGERVSPETIWACTTCGSCEQECPLFIENVPRIIEMRKKQIIMEEIPTELTRVFKNLEQNQNPWGLGSDKRDEWAEGLDIPRMSDVAGGDAGTPMLYWVGCAGCYDDRAKKVSVATVKVLQAAGVEFAILGQEETCTGDSARRAGNEFLFQMMAQMNVELFNGYGIKKILTTCPHCYHTFKTEYPQFGGEYEVVHHTELIDELITNGKLKLNGKADGSITWHDSCYLGRYHDIVDQPRNILSAMGASVVEMPRNKTRGFCCGAGGARFWMEEDIGERINVERSKEAVETGADCVGSSCPFCLTMLKDGVADLGKEDVKTRDIAEIVADAL